VNGLLWQFYEFYLPLCLLLQLSRITEPPGPKLVSEIISIFVIESSSLGFTSHSFLLELWISKRRNPVPGERPELWISKRRNPVPGERPSTDRQIII
jgi:hypothetical protein